MIPRLVGPSLQQRLSWLTATAVGLAIFFTGVLAYFFTQWSLYDQLDKELVEAAHAITCPIANDLDSMGGLYSEALRAANVTIVVVKADNTLLRVPDETVRLDLTTRELSIARLQDDWSHRTGSGNIVDGSGTVLSTQLYRIVAVPLIADKAQLDGYYALVIARPLGPTIEMLDHLALIMLGFGALMAVASGITGAVVAKSGLRPLRELSQAVSVVAETNELIPISTTSEDEIGDLTSAFNSMMASLDSSQERQRRLIADAGHELRTPLTSMRTNVELLVADDETGMLPAGARGEILKDVASQLGEFSSLVGDLVQLSREEQVQAQPEPVDLADVVGKAIARAKRRGPRLAFDVSLEQHLLMGEPGQLERAITNLLDNAVKFSPDGATVHVHMHDGLLEISDEGPGIADEDLPHIFDRFYRSDRARNTPGTGLGLSIVSHSISSHGGTVTAGRSPEGGALFTVSLPTLDSDVADE
ncbi:MAG: sensor histidine kinase [Propionibacteriaceae bacterium]